MKRIIALILTALVLCGVLTVLSSCESEVNSTVGSSGSSASDTKPSEPTSDSKTDIPDVKGMTKEQAEKALTDLGLKVTVTEAYDLDVEKGKVISQSKVGPTDVASDATVGITVSKGNELVKVPSVKGKSYAKAVELLEKAGLKVERDLQSSNSVKEGYVISQGVKAGESVLKETVVTVYVSVGKGNSVGTTNSINLNNNHVAVQGDWIYFLNMNKDYATYRMKKDGSSRQKLADDCVYFNIFGEWIYYSNYSTSGFGMYKMKLDGSQNTKLNSSPSAWLYVTKDWIYYSEASIGAPIYRMKHDGSSTMLVCAEKCRYANVVGESIYYIDYKQTGVYRINTDGTDKRLILNLRGLTFLMYDSGMLYAGDGYTSVIIIEEDGSDYYWYSVGSIQLAITSVQDGWMYYFEIHPGKMNLCRSKPTFAEKTVLYEFKDNINLINIYAHNVDGWVYFSNKDKGDIMSRVNVKTLEVQDVSR